MMNRRKGAIYLYVMIFGMILIAGSMNMVRIQLDENIRTARWKKTMLANNMVESALALWLQATPAEQNDLTRKPFELGNGMCSIIQVKRDANSIQLKIIGDVEKPACCAIYFVELTKNDSKWSVYKAVIRYE